MKRSDLKNLIKECLLEIIIEGSPRGISENYAKTNDSQQKVVAQAQQKTRPALDLIHPNGNGKIPQHIQKSLPPKVVEKRSPKDFKNIVGDNNILAEMFAQTAESGLVEKIGSPGENTTSNEVVDTGIDPLNFAGSNKWASLAFASPKKA